MKRPWVLAAVGLQLLVLVSMAVPREWALHFGPTVYLRTAPVDPRDVMRGDYVRLSYEISTATREQCRDGLARAMAEADHSPARWRARGAFGAGLASHWPPDSVVYAVLKPGAGPDNTMELDYLTDLKPTGGLYLRGRLESLDGSTARARYGLEAYFMQQGDALELEQSQAGTASRAPLEMEVALGHGGLAVLKGHRRGPLEIGLDLVRRGTEATARTGWRENEFVVAATVRLRNASPTNLAIVAAPDGRSFALVPDLRWGANAWRWVGAGLPAPAASATDVIVLEPGAVHRTSINLTNAVWWVAPVSGGDAARARPLSEVTNVGWPPTRFRFEYRPPAPATVQGLPHAEALWQGRLLSPAFSPGGRVD